MLRADIGFNEAFYTTKRLHGIKSHGEKDTPASHPSLPPRTSAELWEFDPSIKVWTEIVVNGTIPTARDGHTASVAGSKMIVFGGRGNTSATGQTTLLGDEWEIDLDPSLTVAVTTNSSTVSENCTIPCSTMWHVACGLWHAAGLLQNLTWYACKRRATLHRRVCSLRIYFSWSALHPVGRANVHKYITPSFLFLSEFGGCYHMTNPFLSASPSLREQAIPEGTPTFIPLILDQTMFDTDMCVSDMSVTVDIDHPCTGQLHVTLYGPGPSTQDANLLENTARAEPAVLFFGYNGTDDGFANDGFANMGSTGEGGSGGGCGDGMRVSFSDSAEDGVWECCGQGRWEKFVVFTVREKAVAKNVMPMDQLCAFTGPSGVVTLVL